MKRIALFSALILVFAACGDTGSTEPDSTAEQFVGDGFTVGLPANWYTIQPSDMDGGDLFESLDEEGIPFSAEELSAVWNQGGQILSFDVEGSPDPEFMDNVNILRFPASPVAIRELAAANIEEAEALGFVIVEDGIVDLNGNPAHFIDYEWPAVGFEGIAYTVLTDDAQWQITLSASETDRLRDTFAAIVNSFETN